MKKYFCKKKNVKINDKYFCADCDKYQARNFLINVDSNLSYDRLIYFKMVSCKFVEEALPVKKNHVSKAIDNFIKNNFNIKEFNEKRLLLYWDEIVGDFISSKAKIIRINNSVIYVKAINKSFANDLIYLKENILEKIHEELDNCKFREIKIT
jgi:hypothetical protein